MEYLGYIIIGILGLIALYAFIKFLIKKNAFKFVPKIKTKKENKIEKIDTVKLVDKYMYRREVKVLVALNQVLPRTYISLPKVCVGNLIEPEGLKVAYNKFKDYFVDFVVFEESTMKPLLVVDVYDNSFEDELLKEKYPKLIELFKSIELPILEFAVRSEVDASVLKEKLYTALKIEQKQNVNKQSQQ